MHLLAVRSPTLGVATVGSVEEVHFACPFLIPLLFKVKGTIVCLALEAGAESTVHFAHCTQSGGKPDETKYWDETGTEQTAALTVVENDTTSVSGAELGLGEVVSPRNVFADNL